MKKIFLYKIHLLKQSHVFYYNILYIKDLTERTRVKRNFDEKWIKYIL